VVYFIIDNSRGKWDAWQKYPRKTKWPSVAGCGYFIRRSFSRTFRNLLATELALHLARLTAERRWPDNERS
jgi:hypothetical protein